MAQFTLTTDANESIRALLALQELIELGNKSGIDDLLKIIESELQDEADYVDEMIENAATRYSRRNEPNWERIRYRLHNCHKLTLGIIRKKRELANLKTKEIEENRKRQKEKNKSDLAMMDATKRSKERFDYINDLPIEAVRQQIMSRLAGLLRMKERKFVTPDQYNIGLSESYPTSYESMIRLEMTWNELIDECEKQMANTE